MLSLGIEASRAFCTAVASAALPSVSPPPSRAATVIARASLLKSLPRLASAAPFLCLIDDHLECPDMRLSFYLGGDDHERPHDPRGEKHRRRRCLPRHARRRLRALDGDPPHLGLHRLKGFPHPVPERRPLRHRRRRHPRLGPDRRLANRPSQHPLRSHHRHQPPQPNPPHLAAQHARLRPRLQLGDRSRGGDDVLGAARRRRPHRLVLPARRVADPEPVATSRSLRSAPPLVRKLSHTADNTLHKMRYGATMVSMAREAWTDERLDDLKGSVDAGFSEMRDEFRAMREEIRAGREEMREELKAGRDEMREELKAGRDEMREELKAGRDEMREELNTGRTEARVELKAERETTREKFDLVHQDMREVRTEIGALNRTIH